LGFAVWNAANALLWNMHTLLATGKWHLVLDDFMLADFLFVMPFSAMSSVLKGGTG